MAAGDPSRLAVPEPKLAGAVFLEVTSILGCWEGPALACTGIAPGDGRAGEAAPSERALTLAGIHREQGWHSQDGGGNACASKKGRSGWGRGHR